MSRQFLLSYEEPWYVVKDIVSGVATQGETIEEAKNNLREALELYYEDSEMEETDTTNYLLGVLEVV